MEVDVLIVVVGMEGVLFSVVVGLVNFFVIVVFISVGYGVNFNGLVFLLIMLNFCVLGIGVVNIDNGFGVVILVGKIIRIGKKLVNRNLV